MNGMMFPMKMMTVTPINTLGGGLHIQLDDFNLSDSDLDWDWKNYSVWDPETINWSPIKKPYNYSAATLGLGDKIVTALLGMTESERNAVVGYAHYKEEWPSWND